MQKISESEFSEICKAIRADREIICRHNPVGTNEEILLWMLLGVLNSYLSLTEIETPCLTGKITAETYRQAIGFILENRKTAEFDERRYLDEAVDSE